jgi:hypothetical protein
MLVSDRYQELDIEIIAKFLSDLANPNLPTRPHAGRQSSGVTSRNRSFDAFVRAVAGTPTRAPLLPRQLLGRRIVRLRHGARQIGLGELVNTGSSNFEAGCRHQRLIGIHSEHPGATTFIPAPFAPRFHRFLFSSPSTRARGVSGMLCKFWRHSIDHDEAELRECHGVNRI